MSEIKNNTFYINAGLKKVDNYFSKIAKDIKDNPPAMCKTISEKKFREQIQSKLKSFQEIKEKNQINKENNKKESSTENIDTDVLNKKFEETMKKAKNFDLLYERKKQEDELLSKRIEIQQMQDKIRADFETLLQYYKRIERLANLEHWQNKYEKEEWFCTLQTTYAAIDKQISQLYKAIQNLKEPTKISNTNLEEQHLNTTKTTLQIFNDNIQTHISSAQQALDKCRKFFFEHNADQQNKHKDTIKLTSQEPFKLLIDQRMKNSCAYRQFKHARLGSQIQSRTDLYQARKNYGTNLVKQICDKKNEQNKLRRKKVFPYKDNSNKKYKPKNPTYLDTRRFLYDKQIREYIKNKNKNKEQYGTRLCDIESGQQFIV